MEDLAAKPIKPFKSNFFPEINKKPLKENFFPQPQKEALDCKRSRTCLPGSDQQHSVQQLSQTHLVNMASMYPKASTNNFLPPPHAIATPAPLINTAEILEHFPELLANGVTADVLESLAARVPNLEERIYAHFAMKNGAPHIPDHNVLDRNDLAYSNLEFMKNYKEYMKNVNAASFPSQETFNLLPDQNKLQKMQVLQMTSLQSCLMTKLITLINLMSLMYITSQTSIPSLMFITRPAPLTNLSIHTPTFLLRVKKIIWKKRPARRSGGCGAVTEPYPEAHYFKPPHDAPPKPSMYVNGALK